MIYKVEDHKLYCTNQVNASNPIWYEVNENMSVETFFKILNWLDERGLI